MSRPEQGAELDSLLLMRIPHTGNTRLLAYVRFQSIHTIPSPSLYHKVYSIPSVQVEVHIMSASLYIPCVYHAYTMSHNSQLFQPTDTALPLFTTFIQWKMAHCHSKNGLIQHRSKMCMISFLKVPSKR